MSQTKATIEKGKNHLRKVELAKAEACFQQAVSQDPQSAEAKIELARIRMIKGDAALAKRMVEDVLKSAPNNVEGWNLLATLAIQKEQWNEALDALNKSVQLNPKSSDAHANLARTHRHLGNLETAEASARKAVQLDTENFRAHAELGGVLMKQSKVKEAIEQVFTAVRINPYFTRGYLALGRLYTIAGKKELAIRIYIQGIRKNPFAFPLREELTATLVLAGNFQLAYRQAVAIALRRGTEGDWIRVGNCAMPLGLFEKGGKAYKRALKVNPRSAVAHHNLAELYFTAKLYEKAKRHYRASIEQGENDYRPLNGLGLLLLTVDGKPEEARNLFAEALRTSPGQKQPMLNMALASAEMKQYRDAKEFANATMKVARRGDGIYEQAERLLTQMNVK